MRLLTRSEENLFKLIKSDDIDRFQIAYEQSEFVKRDALNREGRTFFGEAIANGSLRIIDYLSKCPEAIKIEDKNQKLPFFHINMADNKRKILATLYKNKVDLTATSSDGRNILHSLGPMGDSDTWRRLVKVGVSEHQVDSYGESPYDVAKRWHNMEILSLSEIGSPKPNLLEY